tara:strand:- start:432 stop:1871 length:1440 start_codon:yes stop_codon:yes gene_type:complete
MKNTDRFVIIGAGPSGLAAAHELVKFKKKVRVYEKSMYYGGLARTIESNNCKYDIGPHRFYTLNNEINDFYLEILGDEVLNVKRLTRILYDNKFFLYPLSPFNTLSNLGLLKSIKILHSYFISKINKFILRKKINNFEDWVVSNFGYELYKTFFKNYTEKVWGIDCRDISKDWAAQRIKNLSFFNVIFNPILKKFKKNKIKSLIDSFNYPKYGAGYFYEKLSKKINENKGEIYLENTLIKILHKNNQVTSIKIKNNDDKIEEINAEHFILSNPFTEIIKLLTPSPPKEIIEASKRLKYRNHIGVKLEINGFIFDDNWIYVHDPRVKMARVSNYKNFSISMSDDHFKNPVTVEYFCFEKDDLWTMKDEELISLAEKELLLVGIINKNNLIKNSFIVRSVNAYPVIKKDYEDHVYTIKKYLDSFINLYPIGRSGMFKYNNQDHAMATGIYAARNIIDDSFNLDIWKINSEGIYVEGEVEIE